MESVLRDTELLFNRGEAVAKYQLSPAFDAHGQGLEEVADSCIVRLFVVGVAQDYTGGV